MCVFVICRILDLMKKKYIKMYLDIIVYKAICGYNTNGFLLLCF